TAYLDLPSFPTRRSSDLMALLGSTMAFADNINPGVLPIDAKLGGQTYGQWSENWWQWAYSVKSSTLGNCPQETGRMWFLAGAPRSEEHTSELQSRVDLVC